jgi:hypothetical protein
MPLISVDDLFFLLNRFSKLSTFRVYVSPYDHGYRRFKTQALEQNALLHEGRRGHDSVNLGVWIGRDTVMATPEDFNWSLFHLQYKFQRYKEMFYGSRDKIMSFGKFFNDSDSD